ncbi:hypothetical protein J2S92_004024 [Arthrobacter bambusae]|nr:hypothetical protein [Arthrobacter bambusae]MDQ0237620.1 hypothetical protein [Arthrobacter bambusae]
MSKNSTRPGQSTHTTEQATGAARLRPANRRQRDATSFVHTLSKNPSDEGECCARGGTRTGFHALQTLGSPENMPSTARSGTGTAASNGQGVHIVHTRLVPTPAGASSFDMYQAERDPVVLLTALGYPPGQKNIVKGENEFSRNAGSNQLQRMGMLADNEAIFQPWLGHQSHDRDRHPLQTVGIVAAGLLRHGFVADAQRIATGVLEAAEYSDGCLPELFCGFSRDQFPRPFPALWNAHPRPGRRPHRSSWGGT